MRFIRILCSAALVAPAMAAAQVVPIREWPIPSGARVRILSPALGDQKQIGSVVSATADTLVFLPAKVSFSQAIATPNIVGIEVARGTHTNKLMGALLGFVVGTGTGAIIGSVTYKQPKCVDWCFDILGRGGSIFAGAVLGGVIGTTGGAMLGNRQADTWVPVAVPNP